MDTLRYLLQANLAFSIAFLAWAALLRPEPRFTLNRMLLLAFAVIAMLAPLLPALPAPLPGIAVQLPAITSSSAAAPSSGGGPSIVLAIYLAGASLAALWFLVRAARTVLTVHRGQATEALSFFSRIVLPADLPAEDREAIHAHEAVHARRGHSFDVLLFELLAIVSWFNPLWRWAIRELRLVHEHEADAVASRLHPDYERSLVAHAFGVPTATLTNSFRSRTLKTRITMLHRMGTPRKAGWKFALMVPVAAIALISAGWKPASVLPPQKEQVVSKPEKMPEFPGGEAGLAEYMKTNLRYPGPMSVEDQRSGEVVAVQFTGEETVHVEFVVGSDGRVGQVAAKQGQTGPFAEEAMRVVKAMPMWTPGTLKGRPVAVQLVLPVKFAQG